MPLRILQLVGSPVSEFYAELSRLYAQDCLAATADPDRYEYLLAYVSPDGRWRFPADLTADAIEVAPVLAPAQAVRRLTQLNLDLMLPQMFCLPGMTVYRALFDLLGIGYLGNPPAAMALGANKARARAVVAAAGVDVPPGEVLRAGDQATLVPPAVVKPVDVDNSVGLSLVRTPADYPPALAAAFLHSEEVLVESYVELGREVRCGVLARAGSLHCLPLEEYAVNNDTKPIRDQADKLGRADSGDLKLMAKTSAKAWIVDRHDPITEAVWAAARRCHRALGCRDYSLFDFRIDPSGRPWFLEAGLYCSFAEQSVISTMAKADGMPLTELLASSITAALAR